MLRGLNSYFTFEIRALIHAPINSEEILRNNSANENLFCLALLHKPDILCISEALITDNSSASGTCTLKVRLYCNSVLLLLITFTLGISFVSDVTASKILSKSFSTNLCPLILAPKTYHRSDESCDPASLQATPQFPMQASLQISCKSGNQEKQSQISFRHGHSVSSL